MPRREEVLQQMIASLTLSDKEWDIQVGSPEYKILEAVAEQVESVSYNSTLNDYHFDVDTKVGLELDMFMALFGFSRIRGKRASGQVTFGMMNAATQDYEIPRGTQVGVPSTLSSPPIYFVTTTEAVLAQGEKEVTVPVQAVLAGTAGNVSEGAISILTTSVGAISYVYNALPITGGRAVESDFDLRDRWRRTVFRNMSGTEDQFLGVVYNESGFVTRANLVGPVERYSEQIDLIPPVDMTTTTPWEATLIDVGNGDDFIDLVASDVLQRFGEPGGMNQVWIGIFDDTDVLKQIILADGTSGTQLTLAGVTSSATANATIRQLFLSYNNDIQYVFPQGGEIVTYNTSGNNTVNTAVPSKAIDSVVMDYFFGRYDNIITIPATLSADKIPPTYGPFLFITPRGAAKMGKDSIISMEYEYTPNSSRNVPDDNGGTVNKIDIFTDGIDSQDVTEQIGFPKWKTAGGGDVSYQPNIFGYKIKDVQLGGGDGGDTFTLTYDGETTESIPWDASAATVEAALEKLTNIGTGNISVARTGGSPNFLHRITFTGIEGEGNLTSSVVGMTATVSTFGNYLPLIAFKRESGVQPQIGNIFIPLAKVPVVVPPLSISAKSETGDAYTYYLGEDYYFVNRVSDKLQGSPRAISGLEWKANTGERPLSTSYDGTPSIDFAVAENGANMKAGGRLKNGYAYSYVFTWVDENGAESLPSIPSVSFTKKISGSDKNDVNSMIITVPDIDDCAAAPGTATTRKIYRTKGVEGTVNEALALANKGELFHIATVTNPNLSYVIDVKSDKEIKTEKTPPIVPPAADTPLQLNYTYNKLTERLDKSVELVRLVGMDTLVHEAPAYNARLNLAIVPSTNTNIESLRTELLNIFSTWTDRKRFMDNIQVADIVGLLEGLPNIDNVRLNNEWEAENDVQIVKIWKNTSSESTNTTSESSEKDIWFELEGKTTEKIRWDSIYNSGASVVYNTNVIRHLFEDLPFVEPGLDNASKLSVALNDLVANTITVAPFDAGNDAFEKAITRCEVANQPSADYDDYYQTYIQIDNEIMRVIPGEINPGAGTFNVVRGALGSEPDTHLINAPIHVIGDIAVSLRNEADAPDGTDEGKAFELQFTFLTNVVTTADVGDADPITNRWGYRFVDPIKTYSGGIASTSVEKKINGCGFGISRVADDFVTELDLPSMIDVYMNASELPYIVDIGIVFRARNTF